MKRRRSGRVSAKKTDEAAKKWKTIGKEDGGCTERTEDVCDKFAPMSQIVGTRVAQLFAQADDVQMVSKLTAWNGRKRDDGRGFCLKMLQK